MQCWDGTHLNLPPTIGCPWLVNEPYELFAIVVKESFSVPPELALQNRIVEQGFAPVPHPDAPKGECNLFIFIHRLYVNMFQLVYNNRDEVQYTQHIHEERTPLP
jgi:hypothetical protein